MRENCHKGLTELVGIYGSSPIEHNSLEELKNFSIEPDQAENSFKKLYDHTSNARKLANRYLNRAIKYHRENNSLWMKELGYSFHFITDWGTPYHSPISKSNPVIWKTLLNTFIGGLFGYGITSGNEGKERRKGTAVGAAATGIPTLGIEIINLIKKHGEFEDFCDRKWEEYESLIINSFINRDIRYQPPSQLDQAFEHFNKLMNNLRQECNNMRAD